MNKVRADPFSGTKCTNCSKPWLPLLILHALCENAAAVGNALCENYRTDAREVAGCADLVQQVAQNDARRPVACVAGCGATQTTVTANNLCCTGPC